MAAIKGSVPITGFIAPKDSADTYPVFDPLYGIGGFRSVETVQDRDDIPQDRRRLGMVVYVQGDDKLYWLKGGLDNANWSSFDDEYVPFTGATKDVDLGNNSITARRYMFDNEKGNVLIEWESWTGAELTGSQNILIAKHAGTRLIDGGGNLAIGNNTLFLAESANDNIGLGNVALQLLKNGSFNIALGIAPIAYLDTGSDNIAIGYDSGNHAETGAVPMILNKTIIIGSGIKYRDNNAENEIIIGHENIGHGSNTATWGNENITNHYFSGIVNISKSAILNSVSNAEGDFLTIDSNGLVNKRTAEDTYNDLNIDDNQKYQSQADGVEANFRSKILDDGGKYYANAGSSALARLMRNDLYKKANLIVTPAGTKAGDGSGNGKLYSVKGSDFTVSRNSAKSYVDVDGYIRFVAKDEATIDYADALAALKLDLPSTNKYLYPFAAENPYSYKNGLSVELDASTAGSELVTDPGLEGTYGTNTAGLNDILGASGGTSYSEETTIIHSGAKAQRCTADVDNGFYIEVPVSVGKYYKIEAWVYIVSGAAYVSSGGTGISFDSRFITTTGSWQKFTVYLTPTTGATKAYIRFRAYNQTSDFIVDDISVKEVSAFDSPFKDQNGNVILAARKLVEDTSTGLHRISSTSFSFSAGDYFTRAYIIKSNGVEKVVIKDNNYNILPSRTTFDFVTETFTDDAAHPPTDKGFYKLANGFYYVWVTGKAIADGDLTFSLYLESSSSYTGDGTSGIYIAGIQFEEQSAATAFINSPEDSGGAEVSRVADNNYISVPSDTIKIVETFADGTTNEITTIPATYTIPTGKPIEYVVFYNTL